MTELLKQDQYSPIAVEKQITAIWAAINGYLDAIPAEKVRDWEKRLYEYADAKCADLMALIRDRKKLDDDVVKGLKAAVEEFNAQFKAVIGE
jgi:F-type H+-transporting ATPase subunit alpha